MNDYKIRIKKGSISGRILLVSVLILSVPLFLHSLYQYVQEYELTLSEWKEDLQILAKERARLASILMENGNSLVAVEGEVPFTHPAKVTLVKKIIPTDLLVATEPVPGSEWIVQVTMNKKSIEALHLSSYLKRIFILIFLVAGIGGVVVYLFTRRIARPLNHLADTMENVSSGNEDARYQKDRFGFEINDLGRQLNQMLDALKKEKRSTEELRIGHAIQQDLLPKQIPGIEGVEIATAFIAAKEVNGDFYDLLVLPNEHLLISICDTAGKGISACLFSLGLRSSIRALAIEGLSLEEIVKKANELYCMDAKSSSMFSTLWIGMYDSKTHKLQYGSQGHPAAFLKREEVTELASGGIALGAESFYKVHLQEIQLRPKDLLFLYTDGVIEAHNQKNQLFGKKRLMPLLQEGAKETVDRVIQSLDEFVKDAPQHDDITLVAMRIK